MEPRVKINIRKKTSLGCQPQARLYNSKPYLSLHNYNLQQFKETQLLSITQKQDTKTIRVLYHNKTKKPNFVQIVLINHKKHKKIYSQLK